MLSGLCDRHRTKRLARKGFLKQAVQGRKRKSVTFWHGEFAAVIGELIKANVSDLTYLPLACVLGIAEMRPRFRTKQ